MLRLDQLYFRNFSLLFFATLLITAVSGYFLLEKIEINNHKTMLSNMIDQYISSEKYIKDTSSLIKEIRKKTTVRITIIDSEGVVLFESNRKVEGMENHLNRPEIQQAFNTGKGSTVRYSKSVNKDFLYLAKKDHSRFVRMAFALDSIQEKFFKFWIKAVALFSFAMVIAFWIGMQINRKISDDLKYIEQNLSNLINKKYKVSFGDVSCCREFDTISKQITKVSKKLQKRDRQKAKYTKNLKILTKRQGDIISAISHEFKNPIAAIMGYSQTLKVDTDIDSKTKERFLNKVFDNANKLSMMIDRLALAIKLESENFTPTLSEFKIKPLLNEIRDNLLQKYKNREIIIESEDIIFKADKDMFDNLLTNLIENALKYSENEVIVRVSNIKLEVKDRGIGIDEKNLEHITKRFFRVNSLSWDNSIGIGLYIVKYILKLHKTDLNIDSKLSEGSNFWFYLYNILKY